MLTNLIRGFALLCLLMSSNALAVAELELDCRIDNRLMSSEPRTIKIKNGHGVDVDCQRHRTCRNSIYEIHMGYNSAYEHVSLVITDTETKKVIATNFHLPPNGVGGLPSAIEFTYGDVINSNTEIPVKDPQGRFLRISCDRVN